LQIRSPKIANAKTYTYPRIQLLPYVIRICILHISLRVYSLDSGADNSNYHLDKIVSNLQVLVIKTGKFTKTMSKWFSANAFRISYSLLDLPILSIDRYLQLSVTLYTLAHICREHKVLDNILCALNLERAYPAAQLHADLKNMEEP